ELAKYGHVTMVLEGTRTDNVAFKDSTSFKYTSLDLFSNQVFTDDQIDYSFSFVRHLSTPDDAYQDSKIEFGIKINNLGEEDQSVSDKTVSLDSYTVVGDDNKYFIMDSFFDPILEPEKVTVAFTDLAFDPETNHLTFSYSIDVAKDFFNNPTGNPLTITGNVDVIVLEHV
ncbi:hypothetical protein KIM67_18490, partial [Flagellimonas sp. 389]|uniref:hypothetical protein n=1 Tax=Flagellimonas sp. 389 TaxID=2835862 RepID=UPI001BD26A11